MSKFFDYFKKFRHKYGLEAMKFLARTLFRLEAIFYTSKCINYPKEKCIFAIWHAHQCGVFSCNQIKKTCVMVSYSEDGEIVSSAANAVGITTVRGSHNRHGAKAGLEMIKKIKDEDFNGVLTIDGPRGPKHIVKKGIIELAKLAEVPIVPATYWSPDKTFLKFKTWDEFRFPLIGTRLVMSFGEPISVPKDANNEEIENIRQKIENNLNELYTDVKQNYKKYWKNK